MRNSMRAVHVMVLLGGFATTACAPALSSFQPAHVTRKGGVQVAMGADVSIPTGTITKTIDAGEVLADAAKNRELTSEEQRTLFEAAVNLALNPPAFIPHFGLSYGIAKNWEMGLRYAAGEWQFGGRHQFLELERHGLDLTVGLSVSRRKYKFPVDNILDIVYIDDFVRWNVAVPVTLGKRGTWYRLWGGPRFIYSTSSTAMYLDAPPVQNVVQSRKLASADASGMYLAGQAGVAVGWKSVFLGFELTLAQLFASADLMALDETTTVDLDSFIIYPAIALMGDF